MHLFGKWVAIGALAAGLSTAANAADLGSYGSYKDGGGSYWVVTIGGYGVAEPSYLGANDYVGSFRPIIDIRRAGEPERLTLPNDSFGYALYESGPFRFGIAGDYMNSRERSDSNDLRGLRNINYSVELGAFAEYWPAPNLRTRVELLQGVTGHKGFVANLMADYVYKPNYQWQFTIGPRLEIVNTQFESTYFSVNAAESAASLLPQYNASGGINSVGVDATVRYNLSDRFSIRGFAEWQRLTGDAADSPIVRLRGSEDQFQIGLGAAYSFAYRP